LERLSLGGADGPAFAALNDRHVTLQEVLIADAAEEGVRVVGGKLMMRDVVVRDTKPDVFSLLGGQGVLLIDAPAALDRVSLIDNASAGLELDGVTRPMVGVSRVAIRGARAVSALSSDFGLLVHGEGEFGGGRMVIEDNAGANLHADDGGDVNLSYSIIRRDPAAGTPGFGVVLSGGDASLNLDHSKIEGEAGTTVQVNASTLQTSDVLIGGVDVAHRSTSFATVLIGGPGAQWTGASVLVDHRAAPGVVIDDRAKVVLEDLELTDTLHQQVVPLSIRDGAQVELTRPHVTGGTYGVITDSIMAPVVTTHLTLTDAWIEAPTNEGLVALDKVTLTDLAIASSGACGRHFDPRESVRLLRVEVEGASTALCLVSAEGDAPVGLRADGGAPIVPLPAVAPQSSCIPESPF